MAKKAKLKFGYAFLHVERALGNQKSLAQFKLDHAFLRNQVQVRPLLLLRTYKTNMKKERNLKLNETKKNKLKKKRRTLRLDASLIDSNTLELPSISSSSFTKQCERKSFSMCLSIYSIFRHKYVSSGNLKPSLFTKPSTLKSSMLSPQLLLELSTPIACKMKH